MGKSLPSTARLQNFARIVASERINTPKQSKPTSITRASPPNSTQSSRTRVAQLGLKMENSTRLPLSEVVSDCVKRWFQDTLKEAKSGDSAMQLLVGQMYNSGYGVRKDTDKEILENLKLINQQLDICRHQPMDESHYYEGRAWITRASKGRSSAWKVSNKQPGYNASDSESEDVKTARG